MLQPEYGFCQHSRPERGQVQDWYPNEKIVMVSICLNDICCFSGCVGACYDDTNYYKVQSVKNKAVATNSCRR